MQGKSPLILLVAAFTLVFGLFATALPLFAADEEKVLYNFGKHKDGTGPVATLIFDSSGNLYGTTGSGGDHLCGYDTGCGTVFQLMPNGDGTWTEKILHDFSYYTDGYNPYAGLVLDAAGNLYGTTSGGGESDNGTVFRLAPEANGRWTHTVLYSFKSGSDGSFPTAGLIFDAAGNLYGTTTNGGSNGTGTVFELTQGNKKNWQEKVLHDFAGFGQNNGFYPSGGVIFDAAGNLYGTTILGGNVGCGGSGCGVVFKLTPNSKGGWKERVLYRFNGKDGFGPQSTLIFDPNGNLYGTTYAGGAYLYGTVFRLAPEANGKWKEKVLHSFNSKDGAGPDSGVISDVAGNLYGTTPEGGVNGTDCGTYGCGTVFKLAPGTGDKWTEQVLHCFSDDGKDGYAPEAGLIFDAAGHLFGATPGGGSFGSECSFYGHYGGCGTVFEIIP